MKGNVKGMVAVNGANGTYYKVQIESNGQTVEYLAKDAATVSALQKGGEVEFQTSPPRDGKGSSWVRIGNQTGGAYRGGGGGGGKDESFALSYSKDIAVAMLNNGIIKKVEGVSLTKTIDTVIIHFFHEFMGLLKPPAAAAPPASPPQPQHKVEDDIPF